jgi:hypothetical protein
MTVGADLALRYMDGPRPLPVRLVNSCVGRMLVAAEDDPVVAATVPDLGRPTIGVVRTDGYLRPKYVTFIVSR